MHGAGDGKNERRACRVLRGRQRGRKIEQRLSAFKKAGVVRYSYDALGPDRTDASHQLFEPALVAIGAKSARLLW